jgi:hypothetical protein
MVLLPWWISFLFNKNVESWVINWGNTRKSEFFFTPIQEKSIIEKFIELEELLLLDEMIKEYPEPHRQKFIITIHKETIQLIKMYDQERTRMFLHFSTNGICFIILSGYYILGNAELRMLNSWVQEFVYNLSDTIKALFLLLVTDFFTGFHSKHIWKLIIESVYKDFGFAANDLILTILSCTLPVILDTILKYSIFYYLNRVSPSLVVIYHELKR